MWKTPQKFSRVCGIKIVKGVSKRPKLKGGTYENYPNINYNTKSTIDNKRQLQKGIEILSIL